MGKDQLKPVQPSIVTAPAEGCGNRAPDAAQLQEVQVNNRALLAQYVEAATLAQERLLA